MLASLTVVLVGLAAHAVAHDAVCLTTRPSQRIRCGGTKPGVSKADCEALGCCFDRQNARYNVELCYVRRGDSDIDVMDQNSKECVAAADPPKDRVNCGWAGITPQECASLNCCFNNKVSGVNWCFYPKECPRGTFGEKCELDATCLAIDPKERFNCPGAKAGVTKAQCEDKGCCFDNSISGVKWCFARRDVSKTIVMDQGSKGCSAAVYPPKERVNCGYPGISSERCASRNCCFNDKTVNVPWCFFPEISICPPGKSGRFCQKGPDVCVAVNPKQRVTCPGVAGGVTKTQCENLGCCFDNSVSGVIWCFVKNENYKPVKMDPDSAVCRMAADPPNKRMNCGFSGISADQCATRGCCFNNKTPGVVWCFFPVPQE